MTVSQLFGSHVKRKICGILAGTFLLIGNSFADEKQALEEVYRVIVNSYYSVNGFYNFSANQADKSQNEVIQTAIQSIDGLMSSIEENLAESSHLEEFGDAQDKWTTYRKILNQNVDEVVDTGYPDLRLAGDMASSNIEFNVSVKTLYDALSSANKPSELAQTGRDAATILALMMTKYSARSTSTVSQVYSGGDADITIDALAGQFDEKISRLNQLIDGNPEAASLLDSAQTKWDFIKASYINYNENRVNFIVNLYSKKIISDIEDSTQGNS